MMNDEMAGKAAQSEVHARCMGGTSQVQAKGKPGTCMEQGKLKREEPGAA
jgi:hypothetical protein